MDKSERIDFYVETSLGRLIRVVVINRTVLAKDLLLAGEYIPMGAVQDIFKAEIRKRVDDKKKT